MSWYLHAVARGMAERSLALASTLPRAPEDAAAPGCNVTPPACTAANAGSAPAGAKLRPVDGCPSALCSARPP
eukprot:12611222-Alexandrium_andersonii.AAC.1